MLDLLKQQVNELTAEDLLPNSIFLPRQPVVIVDLLGEFGVKNLMSTAGASVLTPYRVNPLAILIKMDDCTKRETGGESESSAADVNAVHSAARAAEEANREEAEEEEGDEEEEEEQQDAEDEDDEDEEAAEVDDGRTLYTLHVGFGNEALESNVRVELRIAPVLVPILDFIISFCQQVSSSLTSSLSSFNPSSSTSTRTSFRSSDLVRDLLVQQTELEAAIQFAVTTSTATEETAAKENKRGKKQSKSISGASPKTTEITSNCVHHLLDVLCDQGYLHGLHSQ